MKAQPRATACRLFAKDGSTSIPSPPRRWCLRQKYDFEKSISAPHPEQIHTNLRRALCGKAPCPTARISVPVFLEDTPQAGARIRFPSHAALVPSLRQCREFSAPATAQEIAAPVPLVSTKDRAVSPVR